MQNIDILIKKQMLCSERARNSFSLPLLACTQTQGLEACCLGAGGVCSYLLYYIIYIFRLFLGLIAVKSRFN